MILVVGTPNTEPPQFNLHMDQRLYASGVSFRSTAALQADCESCKGLRYLVLSSRGCPAISTGGASDSDVCLLMHAVWRAPAHFSRSHGGRVLLQPSGKLHALARQWRCQRSARQTSSRASMGFAQGAVPDDIHKETACPMSQSPHRL